MQAGRSGAAESWDAVPTVGPASNTTGSSPRSRVRSGRELNLPAADDGHGQRRMSGEGEVLGHRTLVGGTAGAHMPTVHIFYQYAVFVRYCCVFPNSDRLCEWVLESQPYPYPRPFGRSYG
jgi:hypothetical protein